MKTPLRGSILFNNFKQGDAQKLRDAERYFISKHDPPLIQDGQSFEFLVLPIEATADGRLLQAGQGVLCQSEDEAKETRAKLSEIRKPHLGVVQTPRFGVVGWVTNFRRLVREISARRRLLANGKTHWLALERDIDQDTNEVTVIRRQRTANEQEAKKLAQKWQKEYELEKKQAKVSMAKTLTPPPPPRTSPLTKHDVEDMIRAKTVALRRQWPHSFEIFEKRNGEPQSEITDRAVEEAYLLDLAEQGIAPAAWTPKVPSDLSFISALHNAARRSVRRSKSKSTDLAVYLIAFNWELGWCFLSDKEIASKVTATTGIPFCGKQIKDLRFRVLGLVAKHQPGPAPKAP